MCWQNKLECGMWNEPTDITVIMQIFISTKLQAMRCYLFLIPEYTFWNWIFQKSTWMGFTIYISVDCCVDGLKKHPFIRHHHPMHHAVLRLVINCVASCIQWIWSRAEWIDNNAWNHFRCGEFHYTSAASFAHPFI